jgi:hypothetical protein
MESSMFIVGKVQQGRQAYKKGAHLSLFSSIGQENQRILCIMKYEKTLESPFFNPLIGTRESS